MDKPRLHKLMIEIRRSRILQRLRGMATESVGASLLILVRNDNEVYELNLIGEDAHLSDFCRLLRESPEGLARCMTCRSLVTLGACYRGLSQYTCHGGISVLAAPALIEGEGASQLVIVASCAFSDRGERASWKQIKHHIAGVPVDLAELRAAYKQLPLIDESTRKRCEMIIELAAAAIADICRLAGVHRSYDLQAASRRPPITGIPHLPDRACCRPTNESGAHALTEMVQGMVKRDPAMHFTVAKIAKAARMTPNHFSTLFRHETGQRFVDFLTAVRLDLAKRLLRDPALSVKEVAHKSGFVDAAYFTRRFKQNLGVSPCEWRRTCRT